VARREGNEVRFTFTPAGQMFRPENETDDFLTAEY